MTVLEPFADGVLTIARATSDDATAITELLHAAYAAYAAAGLNFSAATVTEARVRKRVLTQEVYVLRSHGRPVGTVTLRTKQDDRGNAYVNALALSDREACARSD